MAHPFHKLLNKGMGLRGALWLVMLTVRQNAIQLKRLCHGGMRPHDRLKLEILSLVLFALAHEGTPVLASMKLAMGGINPASTAMSRMCLIPPSGTRTTTLPMP